MGIVLLYLSILDGPNAKVNDINTIMPNEPEVAIPKSQVREKAKTQKQMAWTSLLSMIGLTIVMFTPWVDDARVHALGDLIGLFYISMAGVVGAYMGVAAWLNMPSRQP